jgi:Bbp16
MILDALLKLSANQQITATALSTNTIDFGSETPKRRMAVGEPMALVFAVKTKGTTTGSLVVQAIQSAAAALTGPQILGAIDLATADLAAGKRHVIPLSSGIAALEYFGANYVVTGTVDVTVDVYLQPLALASIEPETYAKGYTIS